MTSLSLADFIALAGIFFVTCVVTVVTGGTALITVPAMIVFGIPARTALATNMVTLTLMSTGGTLPFLRGKELDRPRVPGLIALTLTGSVIGALLVFLVPAEILPLIIPVAMILVLAFLLANPAQGLHQAAAPSQARVRGGYIAIFVLAIYGGFFSGGYVTMLMAAGVCFFGYSFLRAMAMSRLMNIASSLIASGIFAWHGAIQWKLAILLGCAAFAGALAGAHWARRVPQKLLRIVFVAAVAALALKSLIFDVPWSRLR
jgi:uncharacterized membrane protein YfcA